MSVNLTNLLQKIQGVFTLGPNASKQTGVYLEDTSSVSWTSDGFGGLQANASPGLNLIATQTISSAAPSITFNNIPQTYNFLKVFLSNCGTGEWVFITFSGDTGPNYQFSAVEAGYTTGGPGVQGSFSVNACHLYGMATDMTIANYRTLNGILQVQYSAIGQGNNVTSQTAMMSGSWTGTGPVTSLQVTYSGGNIPAGATVSVYGFN